MNDHTTNFAAPKRTQAERDASFHKSTAAVAVVRTGMCMRRVPRYARRRAWWAVAAPVTGVALGVGVGAVREGVTSREDLRDMAPAAGALAAIAVTGAVAERTIARLVVGDRERLGLVRAAAYSAGLAGVSIARHHAVTAASSRFNPTKRILRRIEAERAADAPTTTVSGTAATAAKGDLA